MPTVINQHQKMNSSMQISWMPTSPENGTSTAINIFTQDSKTKTRTDQKQIMQIIQTDEPKANYNLAS